MLASSQSATDIHAVIDRLLVVKPNAGARLRQFIELMLEEPEQASGRRSA